jgi:maleamate amidohydrolase
VTVPDHALTDLSADFAAAGLDGRLPRGTSPALLLVDPARAYVDHASPLYAGVEHPVEIMRELLSVARTRGIPVYITRVLHEFHGDGGLFAKKVPASSAFQLGNPMGDWIEGLEPIDGEVVVTKQYPSAFFGTSLAASLSARGIDTLVIAGLSTSGCIRATTLDALQHGFVPLVVREAVGDRNAEIHESNLRDIDAKAGDVIAFTDASRYLTDASRYLTEASPFLRSLDTPGAQND